MRYTIKEKEAGERAVRSMSEKAQKFYGGAWPLSVYKYRVYGDDDEQLTRYAYDGDWGEDDDLTAEELEAFLESNYIDDDEEV